MREIMKNIIYKTGLLVAALLIIAGCNYEEQFDPNNPSLGSNATVSELQGMVTGLEARHRQYYGNATQMFGSFGREVWAFFGSDPRFINDWLGVSGTTYPDFFASAGTYTSPYQAVKQATALIDMAEGSSNISPELVSGYNGFAKTIQAYQLIWPLMQQWDNGIRVQIDDPLNPGPILDRAAALAAIRAILDDGYNDLQGGEFAFTLTSGWAGFDTPAGMAQVNRAIAARLAIYAGDYAAARTALGQSFFDINDARSASAMMTGPAHVYGEAPDINNPFYYPLDANTNTILIVHTALVEDALPGDERVTNKFYQRAEPVINAAIGAGVPGEYQDNRWTTNVDPAAFIRNEELILIAAEAEWNGGDRNIAIQAINNIRNTWGVGDSPITTDSTPAEFEDELLFQRRYSLWAEGGHRWIDLRRFNRLDASNIDLRDGGSIFTQVAPRSSETNWEANN
jgi:hypothetical protein